MAQYLIVWNCGCGDSAEIVEADNASEAEKMAYEAWREDAENQASYSAELATRDNAENHGLEDMVSA